MRVAVVLGCFSVGSSFLCQKSCRLDISSLLDLGKFMRRRAE